MILDLFVLFVLFSILTLFATFVISFSNPIYSLLSLVSVFLVSACLFFQHGLDFLGFSIIIVYVGAIAILFLFVIMMLDIKIQRQTEEFNQSLPIYLVLIFFFFSHLFYIYKTSFGDSFYLPAASNDMFFWETSIDQTTSTIEAVGLCLYVNYMIFFLLAGLLLLVAMVGSIVLTTQAQDKVYAQDLSKQLATSSIKYKR